MKNIICILTVIYVIFLTPQLIFSTEQEGKTLFEQRCDKCHSLDISLNKIKELEAWKRTTKRMANKADGTISDEDAQKIAEFLAGRGKMEKSEPEGKEAFKEDSDFKFKKVRVNQFIKPSTCENCHSELFNQWNGSMHSKAFVDPVWQKSTKLFFKQVTQKGEIKEMRACVKCHTPLGFRSYSISSPEYDYEKLDPLSSQGIFCNWCHNIKTVSHIGDAGYEVEPGNGEDEPSTMLGPREDATSDFHPTMYSELHTKSEFCGLCHNVSHAANNLPIENTYDEWKEGPYNTGEDETTVHCQDCHMRQKPGIPSTGKTERPDNPGKAADDGPNRKHIWTHYFVGGNSVLTKVLGSELHSTMAVERLKNAADLKIVKDKIYKKGELSNIKVKVTNSGAGHYLPTGLTEVRRMWLDVKITDGKGATIFRSGALDDKGDLDENTVLYHTILGDKNGEPVLNVALADKILYDHRIPPKGYVLEKYSFIIPSDAVSPLKVEAVLKYQSASQGLAKTLLGDGAPQIPVIDMTSLTDSIEF